MCSLVLLTSLLGGAPLVRADTTTYTYDALGRLRSVTVTGSTYATQSYDYDAAGNRTLVKASRAPTVPTSISVPTSNATGAYTISWGASIGTITAYELYEATNSSFSGQVNVFNGIALSKAFSSKATGTYYYRVRGCNTSTDCSDYRTGANSIVVNVTPGQPPSLSVPSGSTNTTGSYSISWGASQTGVLMYYELNEATNPNFTGTLTTYNTGVTASKAISGKTDADYYYRVRACNTSVDCSGYQYAPGFSPVPVRLTPSAPSSISVPATSSIDNYTVTWGAAPTGTVTGYELYEATNSSFSGEVVVGSGTSTTRFISGKGNGTYYYRVRACNTPNSCSGYAPGPNVITVTLPPAVPPTPLNLRKSPTTGTGSSYTILWDPSSSPVSYYILEESANGGAFVPFPQIAHPTTSKLFSNKSCGEYTYKVKACSSGGACSGYSNSTTRRVCNN